MLVRAELKGVNSASHCPLSAILQEFDPSPGLKDVHAPENPLPCLAMRTKKRETEVALGFSELAGAALVAAKTAIFECHIAHLEYVQQVPLCGKPSGNNLLNLLKEPFDRDTASGRGRQCEK